MKKTSLKKKPFLTLDYALKLEFSIFIIVLTAVTYTQAYIFMYSAVYYSAVWLHYS